jgi:hypothetical protein
VATALAHESHEGQQPLLPQLATSPEKITSTVPGNGDVNPYGVAFVPEGFPGGGPLKPGDILVSNFNNSGNLQGAGTTIVSISPGGKQTLFFPSQAIGLTTALGVLRRGFVIVGNVPAPDGVNVQGPGSLQIIDRFGNLVTTLSDPKLLDGPWDLTVVDRGSTAMVFVSNVLNGTVTRIDLEVPEHGDHVKVRDMVQVASGYAFGPNGPALVVGPTGLAYDARTETLYVASTADNAIFAVHDADSPAPRSGKGVLVFQDNAHLHGPLGLVLEPDGNLITANGDAINTDPNQPSELVEFTPGGKFLDEFSVNPNTGSAFGLALATVDGKIRFAAVNDFTNELDVWTVRQDHDRDGADRHDHDHGHFSQDGAVAGSPGSDRLDLAAIFDAWLDSLDASSRGHGAGRREGNSRSLSRQWGDCGRGSSLIPWSNPHV